MKSLILGLAGILAAALLGCLDRSPGGAPPDHVCNTLVEVDFIAGKTIRMGTVVVGNSEDTLSLTLNCNPGWFMSVSHVAVAETPEGLPQTRSGNPIPGLFPFVRRYDPAVGQDGYGIPLPAGAKEVYVAIHADVFRRAPVQKQDDGDDDEDEDDDKDGDKDDDDDDGDDDDDDDDKDDDDDDVKESSHESAWAAGESFRGRNWGMYFKYTVQECRSSLAGLFRTETQEAWGGAPDGKNAAQVLANSFGLAFPHGVTIGTSSGFQARFTSAEKIQNFLPQAGPVGPLSVRIVNPTDLQNELAGHVLALTLNVGMDQYDPAFGRSDVPLSSLIVADRESPFFGASVERILLQANQVLGGETGFRETPEQTNEAVMRINQNFVNGTDGGFLKLP